MTNTELILNMLAEACIKDISQAINPKDFDESKRVDKQGSFSVTEALLQHHVITKEEYDLC
jgi:hypothetical protein